MNTGNKRMLRLAAAFAVVSFAVAGWATLRVVRWARDLPSRIIIDEDNLAQSFDTAITESYHRALRGGDASLQIQILNDQFAKAIADSPEAAIWIRDEYRDDILGLVQSDDLKLASAASDVLSSLPAELEPVP